MKNPLLLLMAGALCALLIASGCTSSAPAGTATPAATTTVLVSATAEATTAAAPAPANASWTGTWNTTWLETDGNQTISQVSLTQAGTNVAGTYTYSYNGTETYNGHLNATVQENTLTGTYAESDNDDGFVIFELSGDKNSFTGRWVHAANQSQLENSTLWWNGKRA